jgi:hypothetical protein
MARAQSDDFLHSMRFWVNVAAGPGGTSKPDLLGAEAGFSAVTVPEMTVEAVEYKEGQYIYTRDRKSVV